ncbi:MAG TPA: methylmalonyl Co-A mutase-associated GTPase MeaB [Chitinophagaceae bacterium]|nr:methylmalonyl Co-A mutase-associated GTPase MeaB [Chitinophagaceae bacterium]
MWQELSAQLQQGDIKALARSISLVENGYEGYASFLEQLPAGKADIIGITGPPGAGKSTLVDALIGELVKDGKKIAVLCVDPSSPFHLGAVLGDRIRMSEWYTNPAVFIRSLASRGSMGGLHPMIIEITYLLKAAGFNHIIIETVGIGQSEVEIAGLADTTVVVLVPEAGDEIQTMKSGLMEIADIFVVNKSDRPDADHFVKNLRLMLAPSFTRHKEEVPVLKTVASQKTGIPELASAIIRQGSHADSKKKAFLLASKAWHILQRIQMQHIDQQQLETEIREALKKGTFNLFAFVNEVSRRQKETPYLFSICSIITSHDEYGEMRKSFEHCGFTQDCEYIFADNTTYNQFDAYTAINHFLREAKGKYIIIVHQDVRCIDSISRLQKILTDLTLEDDKWAVCGNAGAMGYHRDVRYITNGGKVVTHENLPAKVFSLDENLLVIRQSANIVVSADLKGFHLYAADLCLIADYLGYSCYVIPFMVKHLSLGNLKDLKRQLPEFLDLYGKKLRRRFIQTPSSKFVLSNSSFKNRFLNGKLFFLVKWYEGIKLFFKTSRHKSQYRKSVRDE